MKSNRSTTLAQLAELVGGQPVGDPHLLLIDAVPLQDAGANHITLIDHEDRLRDLASSSAAAAVYPNTISDIERPGIAVADVHTAFTKIATHFRPAREASRPGRHPQALIATSAKVSPTAQIHAGAVIGEQVEIGHGTTVHTGVVVMAGSKIGDRVTIFPNTTIYEETVVGSGCTIHSNTTLGAYGFGYQQIDGQHQLSAQLGWVEIGEDVEIGANSSVDRGVYGPTRIGSGTKIDNLVQIAHNCQIGKHNLICSQVGIAGSSTTGDWVTIGGQAGIRDHVHVGARSILGGMSGVSNNVAEDIVMLGIPATPARQQRLQIAAVSKLPAMRKEFKSLRALVGDLQEKVEKLFSVPTASKQDTSADGKAA